jgi:hypothetical protein
MPPRNKELVKLIRQGIGSSSQDAEYRPHGKPESSFLSAGKAVKKEDEDSIFGYMCEFAHDRMKKIERARRDVKVKEAEGPGQDPLREIRTESSSRKVKYRGCPGNRRGPPEPGDRLVEITFHMSSASGPPWAADLSALLEPSVLHVQATTT